MNPPLLVCDADALIQIFIGGFIEPLKCLRGRFSVQPAVVEEVDVEIRSFRRHANVVRPNYEKALSKGLVIVLDHEELKSRIGSLGAQAASDGAGTVWAAFQHRAREYALRVDLGEAYTFAAAVEFGVPALSNDGRSLRAMRENGLRLPTRVLRSFDLYALACQSGMPIADLNKVRGHLQQKGEMMPRAFAHASFEVGIASFDPRIVDATLPTLGMPDTPIRLSPTVTTTAQVPLFTAPGDPEQK